MKYGQVWSAHWEGAVGEWLRGQLDARGIDAPAYGRYVLSLLTKPLDPADLSPSPIENQVIFHFNFFYSFINFILFTLNQFLVVGT